MIFGWLKSKMDSLDEERKRREQEEADLQIAAERSKRRKQAAAKIMANLQAARHARSKQDEAEENACEEIGLSRAATDTKVRKLKEGSKEITQTLDPEFVREARRRHRLAKEAGATD